MLRRMAAIAAAMVGLSAGLFAPAAEPGASPPPALKLSQAKVGLNLAASAQPRAVSPIRLDLEAGDDPEVVWNDYFAAHQDQGAPAPAAVRETARQLVRRKEFAQAIALIHAALRHRQGQPWMFEGLGLAMQADGREPAEIERALMSALDFGGGPSDMLYLAQYLARAGMYERALQLFRRAADLDPTAPEPFAHGLKLAQRLEDQEAIQWAALGILSQPWPKPQAKIRQEAYHVAGATLDRLRKERRHREADAYEMALDEAVVRDCVVVVSWLGEADVDLLVEEPAGAVCSYRNPRTTGGGVLLGDTVVPSNQRKSEAASEIYVCAKGFEGAYRVHVRRVWGKLAANKVTVEIYWHYLSKQAETQRKQIELNNDEAVAAFELHDGRRTGTLAQQQLAHAAAGQLAAGRQILAQQFNPGNLPPGANNLLASGNGVSGIGGGAVGYEPVLLWLPKGDQMWDSVAISPDRRFALVSATVLFTGVPTDTLYHSDTGATGPTEYGVGFWGSGISGNLKGF